MRLSATALCALLFATSLHGQTTSGSITGTVTDPSGAIVPGAKITITSEGTGTVREALTGPAGVFSVPSLSIGGYRLTVTATGFSISVTGRSTPRDMVSALFHFALPTNVQPATVDVTVPLSGAFSAWYATPGSNPFGSTFTFTVSFTFSGPPGTTVPFTAVTVTAINSVGSSPPFGPVSP